MEHFSLLLTVDAQVLWKVFQMWMHARFCEYAFFQFSIDYLGKFEHDVIQHSLFFRKDFQNCFIWRDGKRTLSWETRLTLVALFSPTARSFQMGYPFFVFYFLQNKLQIFVFSLIVTECTNGSDANSFQMFSKTALRFNWKIDE